MKFLQFFVICCTRGATALLVSVPKGRSRLALVFFLITGLFASKMACAVGMTGFYTEGRLGVFASKTAACDAVVDDFIKTRNIEPGHYSAKLNDDICEARARTAFPPPEDTWVHWAIKVEFCGGVDANGSARTFVKPNCITLTDPKSEPPGNHRDDGPPCACDKHVGRPINPATGNMWHVENDYVNKVPDAVYVTRTYNSNPSANGVMAGGGFGNAWSQPYEAKLLFGTLKCWTRSDNGELFCDTQEGAAEARVQMGDGKVFVFREVGARWTSQSDLLDQLIPEIGADKKITGWTYIAVQDEKTQRFDASGLLLSVAQRNGRVHRLTYSNGLTNDTSIGRLPANAPICRNTQSGEVLPAGRLLCVTDSWGRTLGFEYNSKGNIVKTLDTANQPTVYEYDGAVEGCDADSSNTSLCPGNLSKVTYPDGKTRTYLYNEPAQVNGGVACVPNASSIDEAGKLRKALTGLIDENGERHITWTYACDGKATSSEVGKGTEKVSIAYGKVTTDRVLTGNFTNIVTHYSGTAEAPVASLTKWIYENSAYGQPKLAEIDVNCRECGNAQRKYRDENGNIIAQMDWSMNRIDSKFDTVRNLELQRTESGVSLKITKREWHPQFRLPLKISEPKRVTTYTYDGKGNMLTRSEQATSDETGSAGFAAASVGAPRAWTYTYSANSQLLTVKGPRTDVVDLTTYVYDGQGNLSTVTDPLKRVTTFSDYDAHGNARTIVAPSGLRTTVTYTPRGWLDTQTVSDGATSLRTSYDYDGVGQLKTVTLPNRTVITYTYDEAHRLTDIADSAGSSIHYTLDLLGNRIKEEVKDPNGGLARQTSRVFDAMSRLQQVTGAAQ